MKNILKFTVMYNLYQTIVGGGRANRIMARDYIKSDGSKRILDLCCGSCNILRYLDSYQEYIGVDSNENYINYSKKKFANRPNTSFIADDVNTFLNNDTKGFDIVLFLGGMHHIDDDSLTSILQNVKKRLASDGKLVTHDGCLEPHLSWPTKQVLLNDRGKFVRTKDAWVDIFTSVFDDHKYDIRKDMYLIPYNAIIFYK